MSILTPTANASLLPNGILRKYFGHQVFEDFTGQHKILANLRVFVQAARQRGEALDHVLLHGPTRIGQNHTFSYYSQRNGRWHQNNFRPGAG